VASLVVDADAVAQVVTYVAPGYIAAMGYRLRYPTNNRDAGQTLIVSVVASLPLVALVKALLPGTQHADQLGDVLALLGVALILGYALALVRDTQRARKALARVGYRLNPESTIYAQTLAKLPASSDAEVIIELKDGRQVLGSPAKGPQYEGDGIKELYLTYPRMRSEAGDWEPIGAAVIVPLADVGMTVLPEDPTGLSKPSAAC
jgi:hypothetical protein